MKILFVVGSCLRVNTSANLCHLAYISGCANLGNNVDVLSMGEKGCAIDFSITLPKINKWYTIDPPLLNNASRTTADLLGRKRTGFDKLKGILKRFLLQFYGIYGRTNRIWVKKARKFSSKTKYDYVISLATPYVSHYLTLKLIKNKRITAEKWIQIWEDPWNLDLYNQNRNKKIEKEENRLLNAADKIVYVSPLTLLYQKKMFLYAANKMTWFPLPYYYKNEEEYKVNDELKFGYFGDYFSFSRNLIPFYEAAQEKGISVKIYGNSDLKLSETKNIIIHSRIGLEELAKKEKETDVLVCLCNLRGGQIPGKIYQYSATTKTILFILDGTVEEQKVLKNYFEQFNRYIFCENNVTDIKRAISDIMNYKYNVKNESVEFFNPENIMKKVLECK